MKKKSFKYYKYRYKVHKELHEHYKSLFDVAAKELRFAKLQKDHLKCIINEIDELAKKKIKHNLINAVIKNWLEREMIDYSIHYDLECGGIEDKSALYHNTL